MSVSKNECANLVIVGGKKRLQVENMDTVKVLLSTTPKIPNLCY